MLMSEVLLCGEQVDDSALEKGDKSVRFRGGLVFKAHRPVYHTTLDWRLINEEAEQ